MTCVETTKACDQIFRYNKTGPGLGGRGADPAHLDSKPTTIKHRLLSQTPQAPQDWGPGKEDAEVSGERR